MPTDTAEKSEVEQTTRRFSWGLILAIAIVGLLAAAAGLAVPILFPHLVGLQTVKEAPGPVQPAFIEFGDTVVNLDEGRLNRYLRVRITLQVDSTDMDAVNRSLEKRKVILKNWLLSFLSDQGMDEVRGAAGQNRLRRQIQDYFNDVLNPDGIDRIRDVLFEEFNVQ